MSWLYWLLPVVAVLSFILTWALRRYALSRQLMDIPNERSSHTVPTPRGGGVAVVAAYLVALPALALYGVVDWTLVIALTGAGLGITLVGFLDDLGHVAARWRLLGHFVAAGWLLAWLGGLPPVSVLGVLADLGWIGHVLAAVALVWVLNLYNFMDGIDGIAGIEAITVCVGGALLYVLIGQPALTAAPLLLAAAVGGFLVWNLPPARIFMGDAGSGFVGIALGGLVLQAAWVAPELLWAWLILLGVFIVDATFTLVRRLLAGEKVYEAHRSHAYQYASRVFGAHRPVAVAVALINLLWLLPVAVLAAVELLDGVIAVVVAYTPLILLAIYLKAGNRAAQAIKET